MRFGVVFPQIEIGNDPIAIRDYAQTAEGLGYDHILAFDHVLGAGTGTRPNWKGAYSAENPFHEVFVLFGYLAAVTQNVEFVTGVLVLPQRQTALVAKQAAEVDVLSGGKFRLGVGVGWNTVEYEALNEDFHNRGARVDEQVEVLRALWTNPLVTFNGKWHHITDAGINPMPVQQPIPIWFGGLADPMLKRTARLGSGWFPLGEPTDEKRVALDKLRTFAQEAGRSPDEIEIEAFVRIMDGDDAALAKQAQIWKEFGATQICVNTMRAGLTTPQQHIDALRRMKDVLGVGQQ